jgi:hypothetical protein
VRGKCIPEEPQKKNIRKEKKNRIGMWGGRGKNHHKEAFLVYALKLPQDQQFTHLEHVMYWVDSSERNREQRHAGISKHAPARFNTRPEPVLMEPLKDRQERNKKRNQIGTQL